MEPGREGEREEEEEGKPTQSTRLTGAGGVGVRAEAKGNEGEAVRWNSGRMWLNARLVDTVLSCGVMGEEDGVDV